MQGVSGPSGACLQWLMLMRLMPIGDQAATPPSKGERIRPPWRPLNFGRLPTVRTPIEAYAPQKADLETLDPEVLLRVLCEVKGGDFTARMPIH